MSRISDEVKTLTSVFARKGAKRNHRAQIKRMIVFADFAQRAGATHLVEVGRRQVLDFWRSPHMSELAAKTRYDTWCALAILFELAGKSPPPRPPVGPARENKPGHLRAEQKVGGTAAAGGGKAPGGLGAEPRSLGGEAGAVALGVLEFRP